MTVLGFVLPVHPIAPNPRKREQSLIRTGVLCFFGNPKPGRTSGGFAQNLRENFSSLGTTKPLPCPQDLVSSVTLVLASILAAIQSLPVPLWKPVALTFTPRYGNLDSLLRLFAIDPAGQTTMGSFSLSESFLREWCFSPSVTPECRNQGPAPGCLYQGPVPECFYQGLPSNVSIEEPAPGCSYQGSPRHVVQPGSFFSSFRQSFSRGLSLPKPRCPITDFGHDEKKRFLLNTCRNDERERAGMTKKRNMRE